MEGRHLSAIGIENKIIVLKPGGSKKQRRERPRKGPSRKSQAQEPGGGPQEEAKPKRQKAEGAREKDTPASPRAEDRAAANPRPENPRGRRKGKPPSYFYGLVIPISY